MSLNGGDSGGTLHHSSGESCGCREDALHEQRRRRVQGRDRLRHQDLRSGGFERVLQGLRAEFLAPGVLEYRPVGDLRADQAADEEAARHRVKSLIS